MEAEAKGAVEACGYWTAAGRNALVPRRATAEDGKVVIPVVNMNEDQGPEARVLQFRVPATTLPRPGLAFLETSCCELLGPWLPLLVLPSEAAATEVSELVRAHGADRCAFPGARRMTGIARSVYACASITSPRGRPRGVRTAAAGEGYRVHHSSSGAYASPPLQGS